MLCLFAIISFQFKCLIEKKKSFDRLVDSLLSPFATVLNVFSIIIIIIIIIITIIVIVVIVIVIVIVIVAIYLMFYHLSYVFLILTVTLFLFIILAENIHLDDLYTRYRQRLRKSLFRSGLLISLAACVVSIIIGIIYQQVSFLWQRTKSMAIKKVLFFLICKRARVTKA